ncbi:HET-domain-containing protein, partial [Corynespora cassiicola Philippines]
MRLLHSKGDAWSEDPLEITLREFIGTDIPRYMILSHRWREEEILFSHMSNADKSTARNRTGFVKLEESCRIALQMGLEYVWIDTCCIDKSSSAELSEAINSMYAYYAKSEICFAYLDDVPYYPEDDLPLLNSVWFSRGWTLQELIAPEEIYFYSAGWKKLGSKYSTRKSLIIASGVVEEVLLDPNSLKEFSVAEKMSWAADRVTTRPEDQAYSLMGIFDVNMPPLYGEGREKAFRRLQLEIMNTTLDYTLFAW